MCTKLQMSLDSFTSSEKTFKGICHVCVLKSLEYHENNITGETYFFLTIKREIRQGGSSRTFPELFRENKIPIPKFSQGMLLKFLEQKSSRISTENYYGFTQC